MARRGAGLTQRALAERAGTSQATLSAYERGLKHPSLVVAERIVEAAGFRLDLVTQVRFEQHTEPGVHPFWVPDRLWRGKLPECFATVLVDDVSHYEHMTRYDLRRRGLAASPLRAGHAPRGAEAPAISGAPIRVADALVAA